MSTAMPTFFTRPFMPEEWGELQRLRMKARHAERRERARTLAESAYKRLGTDHPALVLRELAHGMALARCETSRVSETLARHFFERGRTTEAQGCADDAAQSVAEAKAWAARWLTLMAQAKRVVVAHLTARIAHLIALLDLRPSLSDVALPSTSRFDALASHLAAQAPPCRPVTAQRGERSAFTLSKGVNN